MNDDYEKFREFRRANSLAAQDPCDTFIPSRFSRVLEFPILIVHLIIHYFIDYNKVFGSKNWYKRNAQVQDNVPAVR